VYWREVLEATPSDEEILAQMKKMKDSSPGEDGVRLSYLLLAGPEILAKVFKMVKFFFENEAYKWEEALKVG
jgi:hypothetical protein